MKIQRIYHIFLRSWSTAKHSHNMCLGFTPIVEPSAEWIMEMMQFHHTKVGGPVHQILFRVLWGSFSCPATLGLFVLNSDVSLHTSKEIISVLSTGSRTNFYFYWHSHILGWEGALYTFRKFVIIY